MLEHYRVSPAAGGDAADLFRQILAEILLERGDGFLRDSSEISMVIGSIVQKSTAKGAKDAKSFLKTMATNNR